MKFEITSDTTNLYCKIVLSKSIGIAKHKKGQPKTGHPYTN